MKKNIKGMKFGRAFVIEEVGRDERNNVLWKCKCDCGNEFVAKATSLINGKKLSCGCLIKESLLKATTKHGMYQEKLYFAWASMKSRCNYIKNKSYENYGGRGITVCEEWNTFEPFMKWAKENGYEDGLSLDRIDVDGDYCPDNCRWVTMKEQARNRRNNTVVTIDGISLPLIVWAEKTNQKYTTVTSRIHRGWNAEEAIIGHRI